MKRCWKEKKGQILCVMTDDRAAHRHSQSQRWLLLGSVSSACLPAAACFNRACLRKREKDRESREIA